MRYDHTWRRVRLVVLERDRWVCQIGAEQCTVEATEVDHIVRPAQGGVWYDPANLRAACSWCNRSRGGRQGAASPPSAASGASPPPSREW